MDELEFDGKIYLSSKRAAQITGYAKDYVGQLCREGRIEARLVGRNWYVLESSIREHRFGPAVQEKQETVDETTWQDSRYEPETVSAIPTIDPNQIPQQPQTVVAENPIEAVPTASFDHSNTIQEMQDAWQDWFSARNIAPKTEQIQQTPLESDFIEPEETVHVTKVVEEPVYTTPIEESIPEEVVPIHRSYSVPQPVAPISRPVSVPAYEPQIHQPIYTPQEPVYASPRPEGRIVRERRVIRKKKPSVALQALFISVAGVAIAIALIGSGEINAFLNQSRFQYAPFNFIGGEAIVNNTK